MDTHTITHGALWPVVRQVVQHLAGLLLGAGFLSENETTIVAGVVMAVGNLVWMLVARARNVEKAAAQVTPPPG